MVSVYPNPPASDFYYLVDPMKMGPPGSAANGSTSRSSNGVPKGWSMNSGFGFLSEDPSKKVRKPYTITKSRESWSEQEHDKFLEALQLFDRDWKKIEAFIGSKTVIQIRSHAQKYFLKAQKSGASEHLPPPRPKRKAAHPYPQKAPKNAAHQETGTFQASASILETGYSIGPDSCSVPRYIASDKALASWTHDKFVPTASMPHMENDDIKPVVPAITYSCHNNSKACIPNILPTGEAKPRSNAMPDFAQVYSFIGSIFDPDKKDHLQNLKKMDPINVETVLLLMKNLSSNLRSPEFENYRRLILSCDKDSRKVQTSCTSQLPAY